MTHQVAENIDLVRAVGFKWDGLSQLRLSATTVGEFEDAHLSPAELAEQYRDTEDAPTDNDEPFYAYAVWDAVNGRWIDAV